MHEGPSRQHEEPCLSAALVPTSRLPIEGLKTTTSPLHSTAPKVLNEHTPLVRHLGHLIS